MEKKIKKDQEIKIKKIAVAVAKNPKATEREIAKKTWIAKSTVHDNIGQVGHIKDKWLEDLLSTDQKILQLAANEIKRRLSSKDELKKIRVTEISQVAKESTARYTTFRWEVTDEKGWLKKNIAEMSIEELLWIIKGK